MPSPTTKKILIVEDEHDILQLVKLYLEKEGFRTVLATTGMEGLRQVKLEKPDLIVLDLMLPEIDGHRSLYTPSISSRDREAPYHHVDRQSRGIGHHHRSGTRS